jgi:hypothetical protein
MGIVNFGTPEEETDFLKNNMGLDVFVEGGTYKGGTAKNMSEKFNKVYTIEKSDVMFDLAKENLKNNKNIVMLKGDTREHLRNIIAENDNILFWLDAHWSGGDTYGATDECPLVEELNIIFEYNKNHVVLIDDARLFLAPPPSPHNFKNWQSLTDICKTLPDDWQMVVFEDVIYLYPNIINDEFKAYLQSKITSAINKKTLRQKIKKNIGF